MRSSALPVHDAAVEFPPSPRAVRTPRFAALSHWLVPLRRHRRAFWVMNLVFFGACLFAMAAVALAPPVQAQLTEQMRRSAQHGILAHHTIAVLDLAVSATQARVE